jgi:hypothetical protein
MTNLDVLRPATSNARRVRSSVTPVVEVIDLTGIDDAVEEVIDLT